MSEVIVKIHKYGNNYWPIIWVSKKESSVDPDKGFFSRREYALQCAQDCCEKLGYRIGKIIDELSRPFFIARNELSISCSIGISIYPEHGKDINTLKANADAAMYQVKRNGRNHYRFFALETSSTLPVMANGGMEGRI